MFAGWLRHNLFSSIAVVILTWRRPDLRRASSASRVKILGVQIVPVAGSSPSVSDSISTSGLAHEGSAGRR